VSRRLNKRNYTSDKGDAALDYVLCLFIEVEAISADACVDGCAIEEALNHLQEGGAGCEGVPGGDVKKD
jgi:hypothetical protein